MRISKSLAEETGIEAGSTVDVSVKQGELVIRPARQRYALDDLLRRITPKNTHRETDTGAPTGREGW